MPDVVHVGVLGDGDHRADHHRGRRLPSRASRSYSLTRPMTAPSASVTGTPLVRWSRSRLAITGTGVSGGDGDHPGRHDLLYLHGRAWLRSGTGKPRAVNASRIIWQVNPSPRNTSGCDTTGTGRPGSRDRRAPAEPCRGLDSVAEHGLDDAVHPAVKAVINTGGVLQ
jgi:hypothetical protein